jgi:hypothetical protein
MQAPPIDGTYNAHGKMINSHILFGIPEKKNQLCEPNRKFEGNIAKVYYDRMHAGSMWIEAGLSWYLLNRATKIRAR